MLGEGRWRVIEPEPSTAECIRLQSIPEPPVRSTPPTESNGIKPCQLFEEMRLHKGTYTLGPTLAATVVEVGCSMRYSYLRLRVAGSHGFTPYIVGFDSSCERQG